MNTKNIKANIDFNATKVLTYALLLAAGGTAVFLGYRAVKKGISKSQQKNAANQVDNKDPKIAYATILAQRAHAAMVTGYEWWNDVFGDGTNEDELYAIAKLMHDKGITFALVADAYKKLYPGRVFQTDLSSELASDELTKFYNKLKGLAGLGSTFSNAKLLNPANLSQPSTISMI